MPGSYILATQFACEDLQKRVLFWLDGPRKTKRCYIYCDAPLEHVVNFGMSLQFEVADFEVLISLNLMERIPPYLHAMKKALPDPSLNWEFVAAVIYL